MKILKTYSSTASKDEEIEINSLEELIELLKKEEHPLILWDMQDLDGVSIGVMIEVYDCHRE